VLRLCQIGSLILGLVVGYTSANAQTATDFYYHEGNLVGVVIYLDTIGIVPRSGVGGADVDGVVAPYGLSLAVEKGGELRLYALASPVSRDSVFRLAARIDAEQDNAVSSAGPLLRTVGGNVRFVTTSQLIVRFRPEASVAAIDSLNAALGLLVVARTPFTQNHFLLERAPQSPGDVLQLAQQLSIHPLVAYAYPNFVDAGGPAGPRIPPEAATPLSRSPAAPVPWHLSNDGSSGGTAGADIQAVDAWTIEQGNPSTVIAVIEAGGFDVSHLDLSPNLWVNAGELGADEDGNGFVGDRNGWNFRFCVETVPVTSATDPGLSIPCGLPTLTDPDPSSNAHGTAVAGLAAAAGGNAIGAIGVCPACRLMLIRTGLASYPRYLAFLYAATEGAAVINASWTVGAKDAIKWAILEAATVYDVPVVMSMHHDTGMDDPEACTGATPRLTSIPEVIAVASTDDSDTRIGKTGYGPCMGLVAPGGRGGTSVGITTTDVVGGSGFNNAVPTAGCTELADPDYTGCFGWTSAAAPQVSGTIGLMLSKDPSLTRQKITDILYATAEKVGPLSYPSGFNEYYGHGRLNAFCALGGAGPRCPAKPEVPATGGSEVTGTGGEDEAAVAADAFELGVRLGLTTRTDASGTTTVANVPGSGPLALPVIYGAWFASPALMVELQFGGQFVTAGGVDEHEWVVALQPSFVFPLGGGQGYVGPSGAAQARQMGGIWSTDIAAGGGVGYRVKPVPFFALRLEARYRYWTSQDIDEFGLALGFGVVFN